MVRGIPRFTSDAYAANFGLQWNLFSKTQIDLFNNTRTSEARFFRQSQWDSEQLKGKLVLDAGCGSGRFSQIALDQGALVYACDRSMAVDTCRENLQNYSSLQLFQADLLALPFKEKLFDFIYCFGVLQHTPEPGKTFQALARLLKPGGLMAVDVYPRTWGSLLQWKYILRPLTRKLASEKLFAGCRQWVPALLRLGSKIKRIPGVGPILRKGIPVADFSNNKELTDQQVEEWSVLETFDALGAYYDHPQSGRTVRRWFEENGFSNIEVERMGSWVGRGRLRRV